MIAALFATPMTPLTITLKEYLYQIISLVISIIRKGKLSDSYDYGAAFETILTIPISDFRFPIPIGSFTLLRIMTVTFEITHVSVV